MNEATRIMHCLAGMPGYHGTTSAETVNEILSRFDPQVFCNGDLRRIVFTPITDKFYSFKTVAF